MAVGSARKKSPVKSATTPARPRRTAAKALKDETAAAVPTTPTKSTPKKAPTPKETVYTHMLPTQEQRKGNGRQRGRNLVVWNRPRQAEKLLLHIHYETFRRKIHVPWDAIAHRFHPGSSGASVLQHINRMRRQLIAEGHLVPPMPNRPGQGPADPEVRGYVREHFDTNDFTTVRPVYFSEGMDDIRFAAEDASAYVDDQEEEEEEQEEQGEVEEDYEVVGSPEEYVALAAAGGSSPNTPTPASRGPRNYKTPTKPSSISTSPRAVGERRSSPQEAQPTGSEHLQTPTPEEGNGLCQNTQAMLPGQKPWFHNPASPGFAYAHEYGYNMHQPPTFPLNVGRDSPFAHPGMPTPTGIRGNQGMPDMQDARRQAQSPFMVPPYYPQWAPFPVGYNAHMYEHSPMFAPTARPAELQQPASNSSSFEAPSSKSSSAERSPDSPYEIPSMSQSFESQFEDHAAERAAALAHDDANKSSPPLAMEDILATHLTDGDDEGEFQIKQGEDLEFMSP